MNSRLVLALVAVVLGLTACATPPQTPISLSPDNLANKGQRIGVAMTALPKADTYLPGAGCLLCIAAASIANSSLSSHSQTLTTEDLSKLKDEAADRLRSKGVTVVVIPNNLVVDKLPEYSAKGKNIAQRDFSSLATQHQIDKLLIFQILNIGFERSYSSYIPTSDPKGMINGVGAIINLKTNTYEWYEPVRILKASDGNWDEPPRFPGLTNAYFQTIELGKDRFLAPFNP